MAVVKKCDNSQILVSKIIKKSTRQSGEKPILVGFSMGGAMSTILASRDTVSKLILIAPYYELAPSKQRVWNIGRRFTWLIPGVPKISKGEINDPEGYKTYYPGSYFISYKAFLRAKELATMAQDHATKIKVPTLILASPNDEVVLFDATKKLFENRPNTNILEYPRSNHILLYDYDRNSVISEILSFIEN